MKENRKVPLASGVKEQSELAGSGKDRLPSEKERGGGAKPETMDQGEDRGQKNREMVRR